VQVKVNLQIFVFIIIFVLTRQIEIYSWLMLFAFVHEMGHLVVGIMLGLKPKSLHIMPFGLTVVFETYSKKKTVEIKKLLIAIAGPLVNMLIVVAIWFSNISPDIRQTIIYSNILIFVFNLIPMYPLDGGRIVKELLMLRCDRVIAEKIINQMSNIIIIVLTVVSSILVVYFRNVSIFFVIMYLWVIVVRENRNYRTKKRIYDVINTPY